MKAVGGLSAVVTYHQVLIIHKGKKAKCSVGAIYSPIYFKVDIGVFVDPVINQRNHCRPESVLARNGKARCYISPALSALLKQDMSTLQILHDKVKEQAKSRISIRMILLH
jgi:hypothetical protein